MTWDSQTRGRRLQTRDDPRLPIPMPSARGDEIDRVGLLESGADDYLVKPFGFRELVREVSMICEGLERHLLSDTHSAGPIEHAGLSLDLRSRQAAFHGDPVNLTAKEFDLLRPHLRSRSGAHPRSDHAEVGRALVGLFQDAGCAYGFASKEALPGVHRRDGEGCRFQVE